MQRLFILLCLVQTASCAVVPTRRNYRSAAPSSNGFRVQLNGRRSWVSDAEMYAFKKELTAQRTEIEKLRKAALPDERFLTKLMTKLPYKAKLLSPFRLRFVKKQLLKTHAREAVARKINAKSELNALYDTLGVMRHFAVEKRDRMTVDHLQQGIETMAQKTTILREYKDSLEEALSALTVYYNKVKRPYQSKQTLRPRVFY